MPKVTGLGHVGLFARETAPMIEFYNGFLGLQITDRGPDDRIVFFSADPAAEHHEFVIGHNPEMGSMVQQVSFKVGSLSDLREFWQQIKARNITVDRVVNHGIAFGCYIRDPEDNRIEVYWSTGIDYPQPHGDPIDLDQSEEELLQILHTMPPKARPGVMATV